MRITQAITLTERFYTDFYPYHSVYPQCRVHPVWLELEPGPFIQQNGTLFEIPVSRSLLSEQLG